MQADLSSGADSVEPRLEQGLRRVFEVYYIKHGMSIVS